MIIITLYKRAIFLPATKFFIKESLESFLNECFIEQYNLIINITRNNEIKA